MSSAVASPLCPAAVAGGPFGATLASDIVMLHRAIIASLLRVPREAGEDDGSYARRRGREAQKQIDAQSSWESRAARQVFRWHAHLRRRHVQSWATEVFRIQGSGWLQIQRLASGSLDSLAGILGMREGAGRPRVRYEDGVRFLQTKYANDEDEGS